MPNLRNMKSNRFYFSLVVNCLLIFAAAFLFFYFLQVRKQPNTAFGIAILSLLLTIHLIYHVNRTNRILGNFLSYMQEKDPSLRLSVSFVEKNFRGLNQALDKLIHEFKENRIELEVQAHYLETILDKVSTGILCFDHQGKIKTMNETALEYLDLDRIKHLDELDQRHEGLGKRIRSLQPDEQVTESLKKNGTGSILNLHCTRIKLKQESIHIVAINDITYQMEEQEILSWKKLIRVINHEIMNSMTPIITLSLAIRKKLSNRNGIKPKAELSTEALMDAVQSASIIAERSQDLVHFIERYKKLTGLPPVKKEQFPAEDLFIKVKKLFKEDLEARGIRINWPDDCHAELPADPRMLEQVMINLVKNAMEALGKTINPEIELSCFLNAEGRYCLSVRDNGEGIPKEKLEQVYIPFYSTREKGSGIGLSLCRQIIRSHNGKMHIESTPGEGTCVLISL
jgi:nitrogen fixation/metabolism regulation signal transduction histidine kinase